MRHIALLLVAAAAGCATVTPNPAPLQIAVTTAPFQRQVLFGTITVPAGEVFWPSKVGGIDAFCSMRNLYSVPGEARGICLFGNGAQFTQAYVRGTASGTEIDVLIPYTMIDTGAYNAAVQATAPARYKAALNAEADEAECNYEMNNSPVAQQGGLLNQVVNSAVIFDQCKRAKALRRAASQSGKASP